MAVVARAAPAWEGLPNAGVSALKSLVGDSGLKLVVNVTKAGEIIARGHGEHGLADNFAAAQNSAKMGRYAFSAVDAVLGTAKNCYELGLSGRRPDQVVGNLAGLVGSVTYSGPSAAIGAEKLFPSLDYSPAVSATLSAVATVGGGISSIGGGIAAGMRIGHEMEKEFTPANPAEPDRVELVQRQTEKRTQVLKASWTKLIKNIINVALSVLAGLALFLGVALNSWLMIGLSVATVVAGVIAHVHSKNADVLSDRIDVLKGVTNGIQAGTDYGRANPVQALAV